MSVLDPNMEEMVDVGPSQGVNRPFALNAGNTMNSSPRKMSGFLAGVIPNNKR